MQTSNKLHSGVGASSCERWWNCPGSVKLSGGAKSYTSFAAAEGTVAHGVCEIALKAGMSQAYKLLGEVINQDGHEVEVTEDMLEHAETYVEATLDAMHEHKADATELFVELPIQVTEGAYGTCDAAIIKPKKVIQVFDYKYGKKAVEAYANKQMMYYALGAYLSLSEIDRVGTEKFIVTIVQPRAEHSEGCIRSYEFGIDEMNTFRKDLVAAIERTVQESAPVMIGDWCKYCLAGASGKCPAQRSLAMDVAQGDFTSLATPSTMDKEAISLVLTHGDHVTAWIKSVMEYATARVREGEVFDGFKLVSKRANRKWIDTEEVEAVFEELLGEGLYTKKLKSPAQIEKTLGKKSPKYIMIESLCITPEAGTILVSEVDKREAVGQVSPAANDFVKIQ